MVTDHQLIFVGGLHRSGTTPLADLLGSHPGISALSGTDVQEDEGQHVQTVYKPADAYGGVGRFANAKSAHLTEDSPLVSPANAARLLDEWRPYWRLERPYLLEKSPPNLIRTRFLQALFPDAHFVMIIRHPIIVALAMQKWNTKVVSRRGRRRLSMRSMVAHWLTAHDILREDADRIRRLTVIRYEDLMSRPVEELASLQARLGLESPIPAAGLRTGLNATYQKAWEELAAGRWTRRVRQGIESMYGTRIRAYGYDLNDLSQRHGGWSFEPTNRSSG